VVYAIDARIVRPKKVAAELEVIGRIGENQVHRPRRHPAQRLDAIAL
jgi:hypothetical protein